MRKVINKMVTEDDLIRTVTAAYSHGWRQVKLYFMCGLPTETDEDVLAIADLAKKVIETGREVSGRRDIRCTVSIGGFVPKPHTPFQWAAQATTRPPMPGWPSCGTRCAMTGSTAGRSASAITTASPASSRDCCPAAIAGSAGSSRRCGGTAAVSTAGASTSPTSVGPAAPSGRWPAPVDLDWYTTREREYAEVLPWDHLDAGLDRDWLWQDWQDAVDEVEVEDCRWTPCFDCGVCPQMGTEIQIGPTGQRLLPLTPV